MVGILRTSLDAALPSKGAAAGGDSGDGSKSLDAALPSKGIAAGGDSGDGSDGSTPLPPEVLKGAAAPRDEGGAVPAAVREAVVQRARCGQADYVLEEAADFQGQPFRKCKPALKLVGVDNPQFTGDEEGWGPPIQCKALNHVAIGATDVDAICRFYVKVLGFREIPRPNIGFPGHWLKGLGLMLHIIQADPTVPRRFHNWKEQYASEPESWFIRRGGHIALEVEDFEEAEAALRRHGVEYSRHVLPDANMHQLFFFDPEGNGVEVGTYEDTWQFLRDHGEESGWL